MMELALINILCLLFLAVPFLLFFWRVYFLQQDHRNWIDKLEQEKRKAHWAGNQKEAQRLEKIICDALFHDKGLPWYARGLIAPISIILIWWGAVFFLFSYLGLDKYLYFMK